MASGGLCSHSKSDPSREELNPEGNQETSEHLGKIYPEELTHPTTPQNNLPHPPPPPPNTKPFSSSSLSLVSPQSASSSVPLLVSQYKYFTSVRVQVPPPRTEQPLRPLAADEISEFLAPDPFPFS